MELIFEMFVSETEYCTETRGELFLVVEVICFKIAVLLLKVCGRASGLFIFTLVFILVVKNLLEALELGLFRGSGFMISKIT